MGLNTVTLIIKTEASLFRLQSWLRNHQFHVLTCTICFVKLVQLPQFHKRNIWLSLTVSGFDELVLTRGLQVRWLVTQKWVFSLVLTKILALNWHLCSYNIFPWLDIYVTQCVLEFYLWDWYFAKRSITSELWWLW